MKKVYIDVEGVTLAGEDQKVGVVIEIGEESAQALIREGKARPVGEDGMPADGPGGTVAASGQVPDANVPQESIEDTAAEIERQKKALDDQYNLEEGGAKPGLKEAALAAGVDYPYDVKKADLIDLITAQGKAAELTK